MPRLIRLDRSSIYDYYSHIMKKVSISELKSKLSQYLRYVKNGERVVVVDRNQPVAYLTPIHAGEKSSAEHLADLERRGIIRRGSGQPIKDYPYPSGDKESGVLAALLEERRSGR
jgi:prevent-host-death family protein